MEKFSFSQIKRENYDRRKQYGKNMHINQFPMNDGWVVKIVCSQSEIENVCTQTPIQLTRVDPMIYKHNSTNLPLS